MMNDRPLEARALVPSSAVICPFPCHATFVVRHARARAATTRSRAQVEGSDATNSELEMSHFV